MKSISLWPLSPSRSFQAHASLKRSLVALQRSKIKPHSRSLSGLKPSVHVVLIRPGSTCYDEQDRILGRLDLPLSQKGRQEASTLGQKLAQTRLSNLYCGPSQCTIETASTLGCTWGLKPRPLEDLRNLDQGLWQGMRQQELKHRCQKLYRQWLETPLAICPPCGESVDHALRRIHHALVGVLRKNRGGSIGLIASEPLAQLIAGLLRGDRNLALQEGSHSGTFEIFDVPAELGPIPQGG